MTTKMMPELKIAVTLINEYLDLSFRMKEEKNEDEKRMLVDMMLVVKSEMEKFIKAIEATYEK